MDGKGSYAVTPFALAMQRQGIALRLAILERPGARGFSVTWFGHLTIRRLKRGGAA